MPLFNSNPIVVDDGVDAARTFTFGYPLGNQPKSVISAGLWIEEAALTVQESTIRVSHMTTKTGQRHAVTRAYKINCGAAEEVDYRQCLLAITLAADPLITDEDVATELNALIAVISAGTTLAFVSALRRNLVE